MRIQLPIMHVDLSISFNSKPSIIHFARTQFMMHNEEWTKYNTMQSNVLTNVTAFGSSLLLSLSMLMDFVNGTCRWILSKFDLFLLVYKVFRMTHGKHVIRTLSPTLDQSPMSTLVDIQNCLLQSGVLSCLVHAKCKRTKCKQVLVLSIMDLYNSILCYMQLYCQTEATARRESEMRARFLFWMNWNAST